MTSLAEVAHLDPFDLPDWIGAGPVTWRALSSLGRGHLVTGELANADDAVPCDLLGCDLAYPVAVLSEHWRHDAHQAWVHGEVLLLRYEGRLTLAVPGTGFSADLALAAVARLAKAVGARSANFTVALRL